MRDDGDTAPTKFYRVAMQPIEYRMVLASSKQGALEQANKGYGIPVGIEALDVEELEAAEWMALLDGVPDDNGGHYNGDGTAWFYNDETHEYYRLDPERRMWLPIEESWPNDFLDEDEAEEHDRWPMRFWEEDNFDPDEVQGSDPYEGMF
jgi:hypothetical protein